MSLSTEARADLLAALQPHVATIAEDLRQRLLKPGSPAEIAARQAAARLHSEEGVGESLDVWLELLGHRAAVLWVLKLIYVRVLEDRGLIRARIVDPTHQSLFQRLARSLGDTAFVRWVFVDLAQEHGGLPELFSPQPAELLPPADAHTGALLALLREQNKDTGTRRFDFSDERFDGQLLGDLYQELDPVVKERFALLQTPSFVRAFMLDRTLSEALKLWKAAEVRVIDPACGSGHFLIDALRRLVDATASQHPDWPRLKVVHSALSRVVGLDLNDYAAALARARLVMTALELSGDGQLATAAQFHPQVYWADGLEQIERGEDTRGTQVQLGQDPATLARATLTPADTRAALRPVLQGGFQVVVANPPYITESDEARKRYHKEKVGKPQRARYVSASGKYSLGAPFTERCFQLAAKDGFVGLINSNAFAKREFGVPLVEEVLANEDLFLLVDTSGAYIPGHGTPTILVFGRHRKPVGERFVAVLGKRGEPGNPENAAKGKVWSAILAGWDRPDFDSPFVSTEEIERAVFARHPWSLRGGGALAMQQQMQSGEATLLGAQVVDMGFACFSGTDDVFLMPAYAQGILGVPPRFTKSLISGESVRDWRVQPAEDAIAPYSEEADLVPLADLGAAVSHFWRFRTVVGATTGFGGRTRAATGEPHWGWYRWQTARMRERRSITFAFVATHNHFALDRGGKVFKQSAPVIKLPTGASEEAHLALLGLLNSSAGGFWMKQSFFCKGRGGYGGGIKLEDWDEWYEFDSTKLGRFPLPPNRETTLPWARALDRLGHARAADTVAATLADPSWDDPTALRALLQSRRDRDLDRLYNMVGLQEELDWMVYRLYGLVSADLPVLDPAHTPGVTPGHRPFELDLAVRDVAARAALARKEDTDDIETKWFSIHGWTAATTLPDDAPADWAELVTRRRALTAATPQLQLVEAPVHKRRWYKPAFEDDEKDGLRTFLLDRLEATLAPLPAPTTPRVLARKLAADSRFSAAAVVYTGTEAPDLGALCGDLMVKEAVAAHPLHRYTAKGLVKRRAWEECWELQDREDRGETVKIKVPPKYTGVDFVGALAYPLRGALDVPKERFVAHTEVPTADGQRRAGDQALYGWAGWSRDERLTRLFALLEELDDEGVPHEQRTALHDLMRRYTDELARTDPARAAMQRADLKGEATTLPTAAQLDAWLKTHPPTRAW